MKHESDPPPSEDLSPRATGPTSTASLPEALANALDVARMEPERMENWDDVDEAASLGPDEAGAVYQEVLEGDLPRDVALALCERAVRFFTEWFEDTGPVVAVLKRALSIDPSASWAFQRLSLLLTVNKRWDELLEQYDRVLASTPAGFERSALLAEAAQVAKDLAGRADRAIPYLQELSRQDPGDAQVVTSLERLLKREDRHRDLVDLWTRRLDLLDEDEAQATRAQIATCLLDPLDSPAEALPIAIRLLTDEARAGEAAGLIERAFTSSSASPDVRVQALSELRRHYAAHERPDEIVRVIGIALGVGDIPGRVELHREVAELLVEQDRLAEAIEHYASVVVSEPTAGARARLRELSEHAGALDRYATALAAAADECDDAAEWASLMIEAASVRAAETSDKEGAAALYFRVFQAKDVPDEAMLEVCQKLDSLLGSLDRPAELLLVLERTTTLEQDASRLRTLRGRAALLAEELADLERALAMWTRVLDADAKDAEAQAARVALLERMEQWEPLIAALEERASHEEDATEARADAVRAARVCSDKLRDPKRAITAWKAIEERFGTDEETVDALAFLLARTENPGELARVLERGIAEADTPTRRVALTAQLGDVYRELLDDPERAIAQYEAALSAEPGHAAAASGLRALLDDDRAREKAVTLLVADLDATGDRIGRLAIVEPRLAVAKDDDAKSAILVEAAAIEETDRSDLVAALTRVAAALSLSPESASIEASVLRLAEATGRYDVAAGALKSAVSKLEAGPRAAALHQTRGDLLDIHLGDPEGALASYLAALALAPESTRAAEAAVRAAARTGQWAVVAKTMIDSARACGAIDEGLVEAAESIAEASVAWDDLAGALEDALIADSSLDGEIAGELERQLATWHRDRRDDLLSAESSLLRAGAREGARIETLEMLAAVQRHAPGNALVTTLLSLADVSESPLAPLHEAASVAIEAALDDAIVRPILERLLRESSTRLRSAEPEDRDLFAIEASFSLDHLVDRAIAANEPTRAVALLVEAASLPLDAAAARAMRHRAASIAETKVGDLDQAIALYRAVLAEAPDDETSLERLAAIFSEQGRLADLLALRRHELSLPNDAASRIALRLRISGLLGELDDPEGRLAALRDNLDDEAAHPESLERIEASLRQGERFAELATILETQAERLMEAGDAVRAADLWTRAGELSEAKLVDLGRALGALSHAVEAAPTPATFDALARIHEARGESVAAVTWLEQRLEATGFEDEAGRVSTIARLAGALLGAGRTADARACLESALREHPTAEPLRDALRKLYRSTGAWELLVEVLTGDEGGLVEHLREAADVCFRKLASPERAIPILERMVALAPDDRGARLSLASTLRKSGSEGRARAILIELVESYGRRRPPERAEAHFELAKVAAASGDRAEAQAQLETAVAMSPEHAGAMRMLADLYLAEGALERAERVYGTLLLIVLRAGAHATPQDDDDDSPTLAEVMLGLYWTLVRRGQQGRADEMLASAFETAGRSVIESRRFESALRAAGDHALLLRALETRLGSDDLDDVARASILAEIAAVLGGPLGRPEEAFEAILRALVLDPESPPLREKARQAAQNARANDRYADAIGAIAERVLNEGSSVVAASLFVELGQARENSSGDPNAALDAYLRAEELGAEPAVVFRAMDRLCGQMGDTAGQIRALRQLVPVEATVDHDVQTEEIYRLAELELASPDDLSAGVESLEWALDRDPQRERALTMLRRAANATPERSVLMLYESVARAADDDAALLDAFDRASDRGFASMDALREAVDLAKRAGDAARATVLLERAVALGDPSGLTPAIWALIALADGREAAGDLEGALENLQNAADRAEIGEAVVITKRLAAIADGQLSSPARAASAYVRLVERGLSDREVLDALLDLTRKTGDRDMLDQRLAAAIDVAFDAEWRSGLRMERAKLLLDARPEDAAAELRELLYDDNAEAFALLTDLYEKQGDRDALAELLERQLANARLRGDLDRVMALSLRLGALLEQGRPDEAIDVYRSALESAPESAALLRKLLDLYDPEDKPFERADILERLLDLATGDESVELALTLATQREQLSDMEGASRALEVALRGRPNDAGLRKRLAAIYTSQERFGPLADMRLEEGMTAATKDAAVAALSEAAELYRNRLGLPDKAAEALRVAATRAPDDTAIIAELSRCLAEAGRHDEALDCVSAPLDAGDPSPSDRVALLRLRSEVHLARGHFAPASDDLEAAFAIDPKGVAPDLAACLEKRWAASPKSDRDLLLRLVDVELVLDRADHAGELLSGWLETQASDPDILERAIALDLRAERWEDAVGKAKQLAAASVGAGKIAAALLLADACEKAGRPIEGRPALEEALRVDPTEASVRERLERLYEDIGEHRELSQLKVLFAEVTESKEERFAALREAGRIRLEKVNDPAAAVAPLEGANAIDPKDGEVIVLLATAYIGAARLEDAAALLDAAISAHKGRRSRELSQLQHQMAKIAVAVGDPPNAMAWLNAALDSDIQNGPVATELADVATELGQLEVAIKALRAITLMRNPEPMTRAVAYLRQAFIAQHQGDMRRALAMARKAQMEDANLVEAADLVTQLSAS